MAVMHPEPPEAVEPTHGPTDKASVISAVIAGTCTTRQAAETLKTTTDQIRAWKARETARRARPAKPAKPFRPVSPPVTEQDDDTQTVEDEERNTETPIITPEQAMAALADLQHLQRQDTEGSETPETPTRNTSEPEAGDTTPPETLPAPHPHRAQALANIAKAHEARRKTQPSKPLDDEGSFEREELETLDNLHRIIVRNAKRAESGKDCQGWTTALSTVLDLRRRAAGKDSTLVKSQTPKALSTRNSIVFIGTSQAPSEPAKAKLAKLQPAQVIDIAPSEDQSLNEGPPALKAALAKAPDYVRRL